jgi:hypothetical protein
MNQPPRPDESVDTFTTYQSLPAPSAAPVMSIKVPSLTPGGPPQDIPVPGGAQVIIPGAAVPVAHLVLKFALPVSAVLACAVLVAMGKMDAGYLKALIGFVIGMQTPTISTHAPPTVLHTIPKELPPQLGGPYR